MSLNNSQIFAREWLILSYSPACFPDRFLFSYLHAYRKYQNINNKAIIWYSYITEQLQICDRNDNMQNAAKSLEKLVENDSDLS